MDAGGYQSTLADYDLITATPLQTTPANYLHRNHPPTTEPALLFSPPYETPTPYAVPLRSNEPLPTEQAELTAYAEGVCPACQQQPHNLAEHLLIEHPDVVNARLDELTADREPVPVTDNDADESVDTPPEPAMFGEIVTERVGQRVDGYDDPRECDGCGERMSKDYARIFAWETGRLFCPNCKPRSERYSNAPTYGADSHSDPSKVTGSNNAQSQAHTMATWERGE